MIQSPKYFTVNWSVGMKVNFNHYLKQDKYIEDIVRDSNSLGLNKFNYGLLPVINSNKTENSIFDVYNTATNDVQLVIHHCSAVTPAGLRIDLSDYKTNIKSLAKAVDNEISKEEDQDYYILISVNPFEKVPFGDIDPEEIPPRHPYAMPKYHIELLPTSTFNNAQMGGNYLIIGKVSIKNSIANADPNFIPPCTSVYSHPILLAHYGAFAKSIGTLQQYATQIIQKSSAKNANTALAVNIKTFCRALTDHLADVYFHYRNIVHQLPPIAMVEVFSQMALKLHNSTRFMPTAELEEMLNYTFEWSEITPHALLNQLSAIAEINYDHHDCGSHISDIQILLRSLEIILGQLSTLDYIGQRKENVIVNEQDITPKSKNQAGWSILD